MDRTTDAKTLSSRRAEHYLGGGTADAPRLRLFPDGFSWHVAACPRGRRDLRARTDPLLGGAGAGRTRAALFRESRRLCGEWTKTSVKMDTGLGERTAQQKQGRRERAVLK